MKAKLRRHGRQTHVRVSADDPVTRVREPVKTGDENRGYYDDESGMRLEDGITAGSDLLICKPRHPHQQQQQQQSFLQLAVHCVSAI